MANNPHQPEPITHPPVVVSLRRRISRKFWLGWVITIGVLLGGFFLDRYWTRIRLERAIAAWGGPSRLKDLELPPIPDETNGAFYLRRAAAALKDDDWSDSKWLNMSWSPSECERDSMRTSLTFRSGVLADLAKARQCDRVVWGVRWPVDPAYVLLPHLNDMKDCARFPAVAARESHLRGRDAEAMEYFRTLLFLARASESEGPIVSHFVGLGIRAMTVDKMIAISLEINASARDGMRAIIAELLDEGSRNMEIERALLCERLYQIQRWKCGGELYFYGRSFFDRHALADLPEMDSLRGACRASDFQAAKKLCAIDSAFPYHVYTQELRGRALWRAGAVALALRLYALDHGDRLPDKLNELVPGYLPQLPKDPFAADGRPFAYRRTPIPAVYSVNENGTDDGMDDKPLRPTQNYDRWVCRDAVFYLQPVADPPDEDHTDPPIPTNAVRRGGPWLR